MLGCGGDSSSRHDSADANGSADSAVDGPAMDAAATRLSVKDGLASADGVVFADGGVASDAARLRALVAFPIRDEAGLDARLLSLYDPASPSFRAYLTPATWLATYAPLDADVDAVSSWLAAQGFVVPRVATNRLMLEVQGTAAQFNSAFGVTLHVLNKISGSAAQQYGTAERLTMPAALAPKVAAILTADLPADDRPLSPEAGTVTSTPPPGIEASQTPTRIAHAYHADTLYGAGFSGGGVTLGVIAGATFKLKDVKSFWRGLGVTRADPEVKVLMPPISTRYLETTVDTEWAGAMAPGARLVVYEGPDIRDTSLVYVFNEAIGLAEASVLTTSFAHRETSQPTQLRWQYHRSAKQAAALGISVISAAGDSRGVDVPASSAWVTSVGGTVLTSDNAGDLQREVVWGNTGVGESLTLPAPPWQAGLGLPNSRRGTNDLALNAGSPYWSYYLGTWTGVYTGTSFAAPVFAGMLAVVNSSRAARGLRAAGCLNPLLYRPAMAPAFHDVVEGASDV
jgi:kumamolisin